MSDIQQPANEKLTDSREETPLSAHGIGAEAARDAFGRQLCRRCGRPQNTEKPNRCESGHQWPDSPAISRTHEGYVPAPPVDQLLQDPRFINFDEARGLKLVIVQCEETVARIQRALNKGRVRVDRRDGAYAAQNAAHGRLLAAQAALTEYQPRQQGKPQPDSTPFIQRVPDDVLAALAAVADGKPYALTTERSLCHRCAHVAGEWGGDVIPEASHGPATLPVEQPERASVSMASVGEEASPRLVKGAQTLDPADVPYQPSGNGRILLEPNNPQSYCSWLPVYNWHDQPGFEWLSTVAALGRQS